MSGPGGTRIYDITKTDLMVRIFHKILNSDSSFSFLKDPGLIFLVSCKFDKFPIPNKVKIMIKISVDVLPKVILIMANDG